MSIKNVEELRELLSDQMTQLKEGKLTPRTVNAMANLASKMLLSVRMELEYNRIAGVTPDIHFLNANIKNQIKLIGKEEDE